MLRRIFDCFAAFRMTLLCYVQVFFISPTIQAGLITELGWAITEFGYSITKHGYGNKTSLVNFWLLFFNYTIKKSMVKV